MSLETLDRSIIYWKWKSLTDFGDLSIANEFSVLGCRRRCYRCSPYPRRRRRRRRRRWYTLWPGSRIFDDLARRDEFIAFPVCRNVPLVMNRLAVISRLPALSRLSLPKIAKCSGLIWIFSFHRIISFCLVTQFIPRIFCKTWKVLTDCQENSRNRSEDYNELDPCGFSLPTFSCHCWFLHSFAISEKRSSGILRKKKQHSNASSSSCIEVCE